jgi:hypothetical protein
MQARGQTREDVWKAMAAHFLDTETRQRLPYTAWVCVEAGLNPEAAYAIWCREIIPVVGGNLLSVAGEWAGWDDAWLISEARRRQGRRWVWPSPAVRRMAASDWNTVAACMERLAREEDASARLHQQEALSALANHLVDFLPAPLGEQPEAVRDAIRGLGFDDAWALLSPCLLEKEREAARERLARAFTQLDGASL